MQPNNPNRNTTGNCTMMTYYGNNNILGLYNDDFSFHKFYYCSTASVSDNNVLSELTKSNGIMECAQLNSN
jgi:hypothetical protein